MWKDLLGGLAGKQSETLGKAVRDVMRRGVPVCQLAVPVAELAAQMAKNRTDAMAVVDVDGVAVGVISDLDVMRAYMDDLAEIVAEDIMQPVVPFVAPDTLVIEAVHIMLDRSVRNLLIKGEQLREVPVGIISAMDIVREMAGLPPDRPDPKVKRPQA